jgi:hypothetical protein
VNSSGFVDDDSPYGKQDDKGTYYFEFSRPLRTMDQFQQVLIYYLVSFFSTLLHENQHTQEHVHK